MMAAKKRAEIAKKLGHDKEMGILRTKGQVSRETFYGNIGHSTDEPWKDQYQYVAQSLIQLSLSPPEEAGSFSETSQTIPRQSFVSAVETNQLLHHRNKEFPAGSISRAILLAQPEAISNEGMVTTNSQSQHGAHFHLYPHPIALYQMSAAGSSITRLLEIDDSIAEALIRTLPQMQQTLDTLHARFNEIHKVCKPEINGAPYKICDGHYRTIELTKGRMALFKSLKQTIKQSPLPTDPFERIYQMAKRSTLIQKYNFKNHLIILNSQKEYGLPEIFASISTCQYFDNKLLTILTSNQPPGINPKEIQNHKNHWAYAEQLYLQVQKVEIGDVKRFTKTVSKWLHCMAHLSPIRRGNCAVLEWLLVALSKHKLIYLSTFNKAGISWDLKAITSTETAFSSWFENAAFEHPPRVAELVLSKSINLKALAKKAS